MEGRVRVGDTDTQILHRTPITVGKASTDESVQIFSRYLFSVAIGSLSAPAILLLSFLC